MTAHNAESETRECLTRRSQFKKWSSAYVLDKIICPNHFLSKKHNLASDDLFPSPILRSTLYESQTYNYQKIVAEKKTDYIFRAFWLIFCLDWRENRYYFHTNYGGITFKTTPVPFVNTAPSFLLLHSCPTFWDEYKLPKLNLISNIEKHLRIKKQ